MPRSSPAFAATAQPEAARPAFAGWLGQTNDVTQIFLAAGQVPGLINMAGGLPDPVTWPVPEIAALAAAALAGPAPEALAYAPIEGLAALRDLIAARFSGAGLTLTRDNVLITSGGMQALDLVGKVLLEPGQLIAAQSPTYLGALDAWRARAPGYRPMHLGRSGFDPQTALAGAQFGYVVPNFSNPTGRMVPLAERRALVEAARATGTWLVEDDPYGTLQYDGPRLPRLLALDAEGRAGPGYDGPVIYLGTLSKELAPGLRIGWAIAAPEMIRALVLAKQGADMSSAGLSQRIAHDALASGLTERILPGVLALYRARRDALAGAMRRHLGDVFDFELPAGGMFLWARARDPGLDTDVLLRRGLDHGVCVSPSSVFDPVGQDRGAIRINFTFNPVEKLEEGVVRLAAAARSL